VQNVWIERTVTNGTVLLTLSPCNQDSLQVVMTQGMLTAGPQGCSLIKAPVPW
jgi:hypothetical protein